MVESGTCAWNVVEVRVQMCIFRYWIRKRHRLRGSKSSGKVAYIAAHEDECIKRRPGEPTHVTDHVSWSGEEVERTVAEKVVGVKATDVETSTLSLRLVEIDLLKLAAFQEILLQNRVRIHRVCRQESFAKTGSNDELGGGREFCDVPYVIEVGVTPDDRIC